MPWRNYHLRLASTAVTFVVSASAATAQTPRIKAAIDSSVNRLIAAASAADARGAFASASSDFVMVNGTAVYPTRDSALATFARGFQAIRKQDIRVEQSTVRELSPDLAVYTATGTFTTTDTANVVSARRPFAWTLLWRLEAGAWRMVVAHQSIGAPQ